MPPGEEPRPWHTLTFWIGGATIGALVAVIAIVLAVALGGGDDEAASPDAALIGQEQTAEELQEQFAERDRQQVERMTGEAKEIADAFGPTLAAFDEALRKRTPPTPASEQWLDKADDYAEQFRPTESGETATNVARAALRESLEGLVNAIATYRLAASGNPDAIIARARNQRDIAIRTWSAASTQIDAINIAAGFGHQHVPQLGGEAVRGIAPDTLPEGTDAQED